MGKREKVIILITKANVPKYKWYNDFIGETFEAYKDKTSIADFYEYHLTKKGLKKLMDLTDTEVYSAIVYSDNACDKIYQRNKKIAGICGQ